MRLDTLAFSYACKISSTVHLTVVLHLVFLSFIVFRWKINGPMEIQLSVMCLQVRSWNFIYIKKKMTTTASCACKHNYIKALAAPTYVMQLIFICNWDTALLFMFLYGIFVMLSYY